VTSSLNLPSYENALKLASTLLILNQSSARMERWVLTSGQKEILRKALKAKRLCLLKARQVGGSTICAFFVLLVALLNPGLPCAIVADQQNKADGILGKIRSWCEQLGIKLTVKNVRTITLFNGSSIDALSAVNHAVDGESKVGRSKSYGVIHASEQSYWAHAHAVWASLTSTGLNNAVYLNESTGAPGDAQTNLFRATWEGDGWDKHFVSLEDHENYRSEPSSISEEQWRELQQEHKFKNRASAAWWWHKLNTDIRDEMRMMREYPVTEDDCFVFAEGRHITRWDPVAVAREGDWNVYPKTEKEDVIIGVDTASGLGLDASAIAIIGHKTGKIHRTYRSAKIEIPAFIELVKQTVKTFKPISTVIESAGVGMVVWQSLAAIPEAHTVNQKSGNNAVNSGELHERRALLKYAIETAEIPIGGHLIEEVNSSSVDRHGKFTGADDVISALSFARKWRQNNPYRAPVQPLDPRTHYLLKDRLAAKKRTTGGFY
jgi:hypothetical protein